MRYWLFLLLIPALTRAEIIWQAEIQKPFAITLKFNSQQLALDDTLDLEAEFHYPSSYQLDIDSLLEQMIDSANPLTPQWNIAQTKTSSNTNEGIQIQNLHTKITPLTTGFLDFPFLTVSFVPKETKHSPLHVLTPVFTFDILPLPIQTDLLPFAPLVPLEPQFPLGLTEANRQLLINNSERLEEEKKYIQGYLENHSFPWLTLIGLLGGAGIGWFAYLTRDRWPKLKRVKSVTILSPKQQAIQSLTALQERHFLEQGLIQTYYAELASILMKALQEGLGKKTKEMTTAELIQFLKNSSLFSSTQTQEILSFFSDIDQVKFAGKQPSREETQQLHQKIQVFIQSFF